MSERQLPLLSVIFGALVERGWTLDGAAYIDPEGNQHPSVEAAITAQSFREIAGATDEGSAGPAATPDLDDHAQALVHRVMEAIKPAIASEFKGDDIGPNLTVVASVPPDGRVGLATTEPDITWALHALMLGQGALRRMIRLQAGRQ